MDGPARRVSCEEDVCWVCLEGPNDSIGRLEYPCSCPRGVHAKCLARWQLQSAGREEERYCRFCKSELPDWRDILTPKVPAAPPVMAIVYDGKVVRLQVKPGREGMLEFQREVRRAFNLGDDVELDCVFDCRAPGTGDKIKLRGLESYSAAMHCAAVAAGERVAKQKAEQSNGIGRFRLDPSANSGSSNSSSGSSSGGGSAAASANASAAGTGPSSANSCGSCVSRSGSSSGTGEALATSANAYRTMTRPVLLRTPRPAYTAAAGVVPVCASPRAATVAASPATATGTTTATATAAVTAASQSQVTPRIAPGSPLSPQSDAADCQLPSARTPRYGQGGQDACGAGTLSPALGQHGQGQGHATAGMGSGTGRRKNIFVGIVRGLGAVRRIL